MKLDLYLVRSARYSTVQYPLTTEGGASRSSGYARSVVAAEFIQHYCLSPEKLLKGPAFRTFALRSG